MADVLEYILSLKDQFSSTMQKAGYSSTAARNKIFGVEKEVDNLNRSFQKVSGGGIKIFDIAMGNLAATAITKIGMLGPQLLGGLFDATAKKEQDIVGLTTFLGDNAKNVYAAIQQDAAVTPFNTQSLLDVNRALISAGLSASDARTDSLNLANAIAAVGKGDTELSRMAANMQQIKTVGKASAMDIKQFAFAGINIYALLSKATGKSVKEVQDMDVSYQLLSKSLAMAAAKGGLYAGALDKQGKTLGAMWATAKDQIAIFMTKFGDGLRPMFEKGVAYFQKFIAKLPQIMAVLKPIITGVGSLFFGLIDIVVGVGKTFVWIYDKFKAGNPIVVLLTIAVGALITAYILMQSYTLLCAGATAIWTAAQWVLNAALTANPVGLIIAGIVFLIGLIAYIIYRYNGWGNAWKALVGFITSEFNVFKNNFWTSWLEIQNFFLKGIEAMERAWYKFESLWDEDASAKGLASLSSAANERQLAIAESKGKAAAYRAEAAVYFSKIGLHDTHRGLSDAMASVKSKLGISPAGIPGSDSKVSTGMGGLNKGGGSVGKATNAVATGGQKNVTVNMTIQNMLDGFKIIVENADRGIDRLEERVAEAVTRAVAMGASLGA